VSLQSVSNLASSWSIHASEVQNREGGDALKEVSLAPRPQEIQLEVISKLT
jgi:hypothetical protein